LSYRYLDSLPRGTYAPPRQDEQGVACEQQNLGEGVRLRSEV
jgi:hypothetical protein